MSKLTINAKSKEQTFHSLQNLNIHSGTVTDIIQTRILDYKKMDYMLKHKPEMMT